MNNIKTIEKYYRKFLKEFDEISKENFINIDLHFLHQHNLLHFHQPKSIDPGLTRYFQVIETEDKITLINDEFLVWIVPENIEEKNITYTLVALNNEHEPKLELVFIVTGVYNSSRLVLNVLEKILLEIEETERAIQGIN